MTAERERERKKIPINCFVCASIWISKRSSTIQGIWSWTIWAGSIENQVLTNLSIVDHFVCLTGWSCGPCMSVCICIDSSFNSNTPNIDHTHFNRPTSIYSILIAQFGSLTKSRPKSPHIVMKMEFHAFYVGFTK